MKLIYIILIGAILIGILLYLNQQGAKATEKKEITDAARDLISPEKKKLLTSYIKMNACKKISGSTFKVRKENFWNPANPWGDCTYYK